MNILCFGDSNTYGYDPRSYFGSRYGADCRWVDILSSQTGWYVINQGLNGREIPAGAMSIPAGTDLLILMLGTNDLLQGRSHQVCTERMERFLQTIAMPMDRILLIAPPPMVEGEWVCGGELVQSSAELARFYRDLAARLGIHFADAGQWGVVLCYDGVHFTEAGHRAFAQHLLQRLREILPEASAT